MKRITAFLLVVASALGLVITTTASEVAIPAATGVEVAPSAQAGNDCEWSGWNSGSRSWTAFADNNNCGTIHIRANVKCSVGSTGLITTWRRSSWVSVGNNQTKTVSKSCYWWENRVSGYTSAST